MQNEDAAALMKQLTTFEPGMKNVIVVRNQIVCGRAKKDRWGPAHKSPQEVPALYFTRNFATFKNYLGKGKWKSERQAPGPPWGKTKSPTNVMACFEKSGQGIAVFSPSALSWNFGPHGNGNSTNPAAGPCSHLAPVARVNLGPRSTLTYRYWIIAGTEAEITTSVDLLIKRHANEKLTLTNPE